MIRHDLRTDEALRAAIESVGSPREWKDNATEWMRRLAETIQWVRDADERERSTRAFQQRLWELNHVAAIGQGSISVEEAIDDEGFRQWLATRSLQPLPAQ